MENIIRSFTLRKRATILLLAVLVICGYFSYMSIPKEDSPDVKIPMIYMVISSGYFTNRFSKIAFKAYGNGVKKYFRY